MRENEQYAHDLAALVEQRLGARPVVEGAGLHWHVDVDAGLRRSRVHCIHYEAHSPFEGRTEGSVTVGLRGNAHQSKVAVGTPSRWIPGPEYAVEFRDGDEKVATCRVRSVEDVLDSTERWLSGATLEDLYAAFDFVDQRSRQRRQIRDDVAAELAALGVGLVLTESTCGVGGREHAELWAYGGERSCRIAPGQDGLDAALLLHRTQLARVGGLRAEELARAVARWIEDQASTKAMSAGPGRWAIVEGAHLFEQGHHAEWHWIQVTSRSRQGGVLSHYRPLLGLLVENAAISRYFSFTSLNRLCFSRCLLYPFDTEDMPVLAPVGPGAFRIVEGGYRGQAGRRSVPLDAAATIRRLEEVLADDAGAVHPGNVDDAMADEVNTALVRMECSLRAEKVQRCQWLRVVVQVADGGRCRLSVERRGELRLDFSDGSPSIRGSMDVVLRALVDRFDPDGSGGRRPGGRPREP